MTEGNLNILIESTRSFEEDLKLLETDGRDTVIETINDYAQQVLSQGIEFHGSFHQPTLPFVLDGYDSSLYVLKISQQLSIILAVDADPIFDQTVFTLFRVVEPTVAEITYQKVAESLYADIPHRSKESIQAA